MEDSERQTTTTQRLCPRNIILAFFSASLKKSWKTKRNVFKFPLLPRHLMKNRWPPNVSCCPMSSNGEHRLHRPLPSACSGVEYLNTYFSLTHFSRLVPGWPVPRPAHAVLFKRRLDGCVICCVLLLVLSCSLFSGLFLWPCSCGRSPDASWGLGSLAA